MDGVDGILLGAETLRGAFPMEVVVTISKICRQAEQVFDYSHHFEHLMDVAVDLEVHKDEGLGESEGWGAWPLMLGWLQGCAARLCGVCPMYA
jgi:hypothetical protein